MGALIEVLEVRQNGASPSRGGAGHLDSPRPGTRIDAGAIEVLGWALGPEAPAAAVEFVAGGEVLRSVPTGVPRPDLAEAYPDVRRAERGGFSATIELLGAEPEIELEVHAVLKGRRRIPIAAIRGRRCWRETPTPADTALVSIVIPCFNQAHYLREAIESALAQTYPHVEIVVVDDGSNDNTAEVAGRHPVRVVRQPNAGLAAARNAGVRSTSGDFLVFLDADDRLVADAAERGLAVLDRRPECACAFGHYTPIDAEGSPIPGPTLEAVEGDHYDALLRRNHTGMPATAIYRRAVFEDVVGFDEDISAAADYDLMLRIARDHAVGSHTAVVAEYRSHGGGMSRDPRLMLGAVMEVRRRHRPYVRAHPRYREAFREGRGFWREYYGEPLAHAVRAALHERRLGDALRGASTLMRHDRGRVPGAIFGRKRD